MRRARADELAEAGQPVSASCWHPAGQRTLAPTKKASASKPAPTTTSESVTSIMVTGAARAQWSHQPPGLVQSGERSVSRPPGRRPPGPATSVLVLPGQDALADPFDARRRAPCTMIWVACARIAAVLAARLRTRRSGAHLVVRGPEGSVSASASAIDRAALTPSRPDRSIAVARTERGMAVA